MDRGRLIEKALLRHGYMLMWKTDHRSRPSGKATCERSRRCSAQKRTHQPPTLRRRELSRSMGREARPFAVRIEPIEE